MSRLIVTLMSACSLLGQTAGAPLKSEPVKVEKEVDLHTKCQAEIDALKARIVELSLKVASKDAGLQFLQLERQAEEARKTADAKAAVLTSK